MKISYKRLWKLLIDREMLKKDLAEKADISTTSIAKLGKNENVNTDEYNAIAKIENKLGVEVPEFYYRPYGMEFREYFVDKVSDAAWLEYQYEKDIISFHIDKQNENTASNIQSMSGTVGKTVITNDEEIKVTIEKIKEKGDKIPSYTAKWKKDNVDYFLSGKISEKEITKIIKNMVY